MGITINGKPYASWSDGNSDSKVDNAEVTRATGTDAWDAKINFLSMTSLTELMNAASYGAGTTWTLDQLLEHAGDTQFAFSDDAKVLSEQIKKETSKLEALDNASTELKTKISTVKQAIEALLKGRTEKDLTPTELQELNALKEQQGLLAAAKDHTEKVLSGLIEKLKTEAAAAEKGNDGLEDGTHKDGKLNAEELTALKDSFQHLKQRLGVVGSKLQDALDAKAASKPGAKAAAGGSSGAGDADDAPRSGARAATGGGPFGQARAGGGLGGFPPMDMNALLMSNYMQQNQLEGQDAMHKTENESKRMMLLFFMLARMAMSGDVGAMYQFLRFIGHIVNKDKAMQNVQLARKLIELQDVSRKLTQMLVDAPAHDEDDQGVQAEYMKLQQKVQAEQGVIATSQKLIAQMLEEFTQVSEMMTGMVKSLLDARGRELSMLAVWRA